MENGDDVNRKFSKEDVISKLKDDGDFDRLRLKIIRKLKDNEELRNSIKAMVKESAALNRAGAENLKRWQLSDAIHQDVGDKVMSEISESLWEIIRGSGDDGGMKSEIAETVQSVYFKLENPNVETPSASVVHKVAGDDDNNITNSVGDENVEDTIMLDGEPQEPPGFSISRLPDPSKNNNKQEEEVLVESGDVDIGMPPGFSAILEPDEDDPDVPPGFG